MIIFRLFSKKKHNLSKKEVRKNIKGKKVKKKKRIVLQVNFFSIFLFHFLNNKKFIIKVNLNNCIKKFPCSLIVVIPRGTCLIDSTKPTKNFLQTQTFNKDQVFNPCSNKNSFNYGPTSLESNVRTTCQC